MHKPNHSVLLFLPPMHRQIQDLYDNLERIEPFVKNGSYLLRIYPVCGPMDVLVLAPKKEQGALIKVQDVGTNFHLMTLLERALYQKEWDQRFGLSADVKSPESLKVFAYASGEDFLLICLTSFIVIIISILQIRIRMMKSPASSPSIPEPLPLTIPV